MNKKVILCILDGWGLAPPDKFNAIDNAPTPTMDMLMETYPWCRMKTDGANVGLPDGQVGTSESNHLVIGSGTIPKQDLFKVDDAIADGSFFTNEQLTGLLNHVTDHGGALHIAGVLSDGGVHSHVRHIWALLKKLKEMQFKQSVYFHVFTDGRDTPPHSAEGYLQQLEDAIKNYGNAHIATIQGRYYLDRDKDWEKTERAFQLIFNGTGQAMNTWQEVMADAYSKMREGNDNDQYVGQYVLPIHSSIKPGDGFLFTHFRADRAYQLLKRIQDESREKVFLTSLFKPSEELWYTPLFTSDTVQIPLSEIISKAGKKQAHITETEKQPHVTYYFNGRREHEENGEVWECLESNRSIKPFYNLDSAMRAHEFTDTIVTHLEKNDVDFIIVNFTNTDMVGHTGSYEAALCAAAAVDYCISRVYEVLKNHLDEWSMIITADHGNSDIMWDYKNNQAHTQHTHSLVPCIVIDSEVKKLKQEVTMLNDIAPTVLALMGLKKPVVMTGNSLI